MTLEEFKEKYPETAKEIEQMSHEKLLLEYLSEVSDKEHFQEKYNQLDKKCKDLEFIVNLGTQWLSRNYRSEDLIIISKEKSKLLKVEEEFI